MLAVLGALVAGILLGVYGSTALGRLRRPRRSGPTPLGGRDLPVVRGPLGPRARRGSRR